MNIIIGREAADKLRDKYTVLELEKVQHQDGMEFDAFCVVPAEKIPLGELSELHQWAALHENLIKEWRKGNIKFCQDAIEHLHGKFGGELDSFYDHITALIAE